jgi:hypothetical protein
MQHGKGRLMGNNRDIVMMLDMNVHVMQICRHIIIAVMLVLFFLSLQARAGEIEPRAYGNTPVGVNFLVLGYGYSEGGLSTAASSPIKDAQLQIHTEVFAYARTLDVWGKPGKVDVIIPYSSLSGTASVSGQPRERKVSGFNDPRFRFSVILFGAPVVHVKEFARYQQDLIIGVSLQVSPPLGQYDSAKLVNLGNNRWFFKPEIGISKAWGEFTLEFSTGLFFFTDNGDYYGGKTLKQDPISSTQLHAMYNFGKGIWAALSGTYDYGGHTTADGVGNDDRSSNSRVGLTIGLPINRNNSIKLYGSTGISTRTGSDYDLAGIAWQYRWGGGL